MAQEGGAVASDAPPPRSNTPPTSGPAPIRILRVCLDNRVLGGVEVSETSTLADVRESIADDEIQGVPENYLFLFSGAPVTRRQEARRRALVCFPFGFLTILPEGAHIEQPPEEALGGAPSPASPSAAQPAGSLTGDLSVQLARSGGDVAGPPPPAPALAVPEAPSPQSGSSLQLELVITDGPLEGTTLSIGDDGACVGRHTSNDLVIPEAGISRYHCEIRRMNGGYCVKDLGSVTGTFFYLKPHGHFQMFEGLMVKLGETEMQVLSQTPPDSSVCEQVLHLYEGPFTGHKVCIPATGISIGRRHDNNLVLTPDGTVSAHHAVIFSQDGRWFIADLGSCNGTCVRLSPERTDSGWHPIMDGDVLGAGCTKILCRVHEAAEAPAVAQA
eukprot:TRINITY_DN42531_c0_g1_i2.p1 TRINITY_DN42531_c0_g1~~TRINITY_DN42531_c0_g1_i2.p1  ORF type:complete len:387 (+),score=70.98 TRINITY_DN42531_c0_g1_i2:91-1251(+)